MLNRIIKFRYYYTLEELFQTWTKAALQTLTATYSKTNPTYDTLFEPVINLIYDRYCDWYVGYIDKFPCEDDQPTAEEIEKVKAKFIRELASIYRMTCDRYLKLLSLYDSEKNKLMDKLTNTVIETGSNRTNDTPQNGGDFDDDEHTSLYMSSDRNATSTIDPQTIMSRLDEIQNKYMNLYNDWVKEFKDLFFIGD